MKNNERLDDLLIEGMKLWQRTDQFCFAIDAVILAHFPKFHEKRTYADLGTGTGVIPLLMTTRGAKQITAIEVNPLMAELAARNVELNKKEDFIEVVQADYCQLSGAMWIGRFDGILINPPYFNSQQGKQPQALDVSLARHEMKYSLAAIVQAAARLVKYRGQVWWIYNAERLVDLVVALRSANLEPKRLRYVHSFPHTKAKLVLIESCKAGQVGLITEPPLYIYEQPKVYSEEVRSWYER
ncbi:tRNA1(Val) (adenine(37)-N6)-methyltransferase [Veillonella intestinalis]|uniref:tRNA1(Val) (adenine(37)-N6)-methyltransferase n=1 Tax=Veillonella intestinalis TaxID=2941341 RepID=UPI0020403D5C|nr:methyltransferase [Veillonella intestinalis]